MACSPKELKEVKSLLDMYEAVVFSKVRFHKLSKKAEVTKYDDGKKVLDLIHKLGASPRDFVLAQIFEYSRKNKKAAEVPTIKMMAAPAAIDRWSNYMIKRGKLQEIRPKEQEIMDYNNDHVSKIMVANSISSLEEFFKDPYCVAQLSKNYVLNHPVFKKLNSEDYYSKNGFSVEDIF